MIIDAIVNSARFESLNPYFKQVFDYIKTHDLTAMAPGKIVIDGENAWISIDEVEGKNLKSAKIETHNKYVDIQLLLKGNEMYGWKSRADLKKAEESYNAQKDFTLYTDPVELYFTMQQGNFVVFFPEDGHAPCIGEGYIKKAVAKVRFV